MDDVIPKEFKGAWDGEEWDIVGKGYKHFAMLKRPILVLLILRGFFT